MRKFLLLGWFAIGNFSILVVAVLALTIYTTKNSAAADLPVPQNVEIVQSAYSSYSGVPASETMTSGKITASDARMLLVEQFFRKYASPMMGSGKLIVASADKYKLPFNIMPAIAQCEGNLGKVMPYNSYNPFGFGIYGDQVIRFSSWAESFETVAKYLRKDYFDLGLTTPDLIMPKYTPPSKGSWAFCVNSFMQEME